jgi:hypothetical protein
VAYSILREERRQIIRENLREKRRSREIRKLQGKEVEEEEEEALSGRKLRRTDEMTVAVVNRRHRHKLQLRRTIRNPVCLIKVCDTNVIS